VAHNLGDRAVTTRLLLGEGAGVLHERGVTVSQDELTLDPGSSICARAAAPDAAQFRPAPRG
jgi:hypothetical protein